MVQKELHLCRYVSPRKMVSYTRWQIYVFYLDGCVLVQAMFTGDQKAKGWEW